MNRDTTKQLRSSIGLCVVVCIALGIIGCVGVRKLQNAKLAPMPIMVSAPPPPVVPTPAKRPDWLAWDNTNPTNDWPFMWIEIRSTTNTPTNLAQFKTVVWKPIGSNTVYRPSTNRMEFYIARFAVIKDGLTNYSDWNTK